jgi:hypothetical protein
VNLRSIGNPVAENTLITAIMDIYDSSNTVNNIQFQFPAEFLKSPQARDPVKYPLATINSLVQFVATTPPPPSGVQLKAYDNVVQLLLPNMKSMAIDSSGEVTNLSEKNLVMTGIRFTQSGSPNLGSYFGTDGPLSSRVYWYTSTTGKTIDIYADFPGAASPGQRAVYLGETRTGFCGGYYSPLMIFFDDEMPGFTGKSNFSLTESHKTIYWPEAHSKGYFIAIDKNHNQKIDDGNELFGDTQGFKNGFENLASYDLNKDNVIDKKDKVFNELIFWNDENGDGIAQPSELKTAKQLGIERINLKYENETRMFGERAEYKEKSSFEFRKSGKPKKGTAVDMWFSPAGGAL